MTQGLIGNNRLQGYGAPKDTSIIHGPRYAPAAAISIAQATRPRRVLMAQNEPASCRQLMEYISADPGFEVSWLHDGSSVIAEIRASMPALVLLDRVLDGEDGFAVCRAIRELCDVPVIIVTAYTTECDRINGFEAGADDYICKPFSPREVMARMRTVLRRAGSSVALPVARIAIDEERCEASLDGRALDLTVVEFRLLHTLARNRGRVYSRDELLDRIYPDYRVVSDRTVDTHIKNLRRKLERAAPGDNLIKSIYGVGYKLDLASRDQAIK